MRIVAMVLSLRSLCKQAIPPISGMIVLLSVLAVCSLAWQHLQNQRIELETLPYSSLVRKSLEAKEAKFHSKILRQLKMIQSIMFGRNINKDARAMQGAPDKTI